MGFEIGDLPGRHGLPEDAEHGQQRLLGCGGTDAEGCPEMLGSGTALTMTAVSRT